MLAKHDYHDLYFDRYSESSKEDESDRAEPYDITKPGEATADFNDLANAAYQTMREPLKEVYNVTVDSSSHYKREIKKADVHIEF